MYLNLNFPQSTFKNKIYLFILEREIVESAHEHGKGGGTRRESLADSMLCVELAWGSSHYPEIMT